MNIETETRYFIGWDVGGWNCEKNAKSRDALVILDSQRRLCGKPWRGNLRETIEKASNAQQWVKMLFALCEAPCPSLDACTIGIDTPLAFPAAFIDLLSGQAAHSLPPQSSQNPYLYRYCERYLAQKLQITPLSPIKDMIGAQATKGIHALKKFLPQTASCGIWSDGAISAIEAYPAPCKRSKRMKRFLGEHGVDLAARKEGLAPKAPYSHEDMEDALACALIAWLFANEPDALLAPTGECPKNEGWIWLPADIDI